METTESLWLKIIQRGRQKNSSPPEAYFQRNTRLIVRKIRRAAVNTIRGKNQNFVKAWIWPEGNDGPGGVYDGWHGIGESVDLPAGFRAFNFGLFP